MFGPNTLTEFTYDMHFSHRSENFKLLYKDVTKSFKLKFNLKNYDIIYVPGSGTTAMEVVIRSLSTPVSVIGEPGKFKERWEQLANHMLINNKNGVPLYCELETSKSKRNKHAKGGIVDAISSFPYYPISPDTRVFVTSTNKQLGTFPGLAIIGVRKDSWYLFERPDTSKLFSCMNINSYRKYAKKYQTPTTTPLQIFDQLNNFLQLFNLNNHILKINNNCKIIENEIGRENLIGDKCGPVLTIPKKCISLRLSNKYKLYNYNNSALNYQIFTYSNDSVYYEKFIEDLKNDNFKRF